MWIALGLFFTLWWTWVGFAVLYNRHGADAPLQRLLFLAGSVPAGVAAVAIEPAADGDTAGVRRQPRDHAARAGGDLAWSHEDSPPRVTRACLASAALFGLSVVAPEPFRYVLWGIAISVESSSMLVEDREAARRARRDHDWSALAPADPDDAVDAHHFAERFGLFLIILLGEVLVEAGQASSAGELDTTGVWAALVAAMLLAGALWWLYFDSAAEVNLKVLELSGGSPTMARAIFAVGHMLPCFALLITASGVGLLLEPDPPAIAYWLASIGVGMYLAGTRAFLVGHSRVPPAIRTLMIVATFWFGQLHGDLSGHAYLWLLAGWVILCAALATRHARGGTRTHNATVGSPF